MSRKTFNVFASRVQNYRRSLSEKYGLDSTWLGRKICALPAAIWTGGVCTTYHLATALLVGVPKSCADRGKYLKAQFFYVVKDLQESFGRLISIFHDKYGFSLVQESRFQKACYRAYATSSPSLQQKIQMLNNTKLNGKVEGVYISTNEQNFDSTLEILSREKKVENSCHIGFSGWSNLDMMASRRSDYGVICDFNPKNKEFMDTTLRLLQESKDRHDFVEKLLPYIETNEAVFSYNIRQTYDSAVEEVKQQLDEPNSWLFDDDRFNYIKRLACENKITVITEDIRETKTFERLASILQGEGLVVDTVYISNIQIYMHEKEDREKFIRTLAALVKEETLVINCPRVRHPCSDGEQVVGLAQHVYKGRDLAKDPQKYFTQDCNPI